MKKSPITQRAEMDAVSMFVSCTVTPELYDQVQDTELPDDFIAWQPFENWPLQDLAEAVSNAKENIETAIRDTLKEAHTELMRKAMADDLSLDVNTWDLEALLDGD